MDDKAERAAQLLSLEKQLTNGHRGDITTMSDCIVEMSRSVRLLLTSDLINSDSLSKFCHDQHSKKIGWPAVSLILGLALPILIPIAVGFLTK